MSLVNELGAVALFCVGLYAVLVKRNLVRIVMGLSIIEASSYLLLVSLAWRPRTTAPLLVNPPTGASPDSLVRGNVADPVLHNFCLTAIVIGVAVTGVFLAVVVRLAQHLRSVDADDARTLQG